MARDSDHSDFDLINVGLKSCPFCGGDAHVNTVDYSPSYAAEQEWDQTRFFGVNCSRCGTDNKSMVGHRTALDAAVKWNTRVAEQVSA